MGKKKKVQLTNFVTAAFSPHVWNSWLRNPGNLCLWNPESWALESGIQLKESGIPLTIEIRNQSSTDKESGIQYFESEMHGVESRIQDCLTTSVLLLTASLYLFH